VLDRTSTRVCLRPYPHRLATPPLSLFHLFRNSVQTWKHCLDVCVWCCWFHSSKFSSCKSIEIDWSIDWLIQESLLLSPFPYRSLLPAVSNGSFHLSYSLVPHVSLTQSSSASLFTCLAVLETLSHLSTSQSLDRTLHSFTVTDNKQTYILMSWLVDDVKLIIIIIIIYLIIIIINLFIITYYCYIIIIIIINFFYYYCDWFFSMLMIFQPIIQNNTNISLSFSCIIIKTGLVRTYFYFGPTNLICNLIWWLTSWWSRHSYHDISCLLLFPSSCVNSVFSLISGLCVTLFF